MKFLFSIFFILARVIVGVFFSFKCSKRLQNMDTDIADGPSTVKNKVTIKTKHYTHTYICKIGRNTHTFIGKIRNK